jgi:predicted GH43/DUF377 family glycosyl hydrolase
MTSTTELARFEPSVQRKGIVLAPSGDPTEIEGILNPACARTPAGELLLYPRCVAAGNYSRVGIARGHVDGDRVTFERVGFALEPTMPYEKRTVPGGMGCEDPRVTYVPELERYVMVYTAYGPTGPRIVFALSRDGYAWERLGPVDFQAHGLPFGDDKDGMFFPEPVVSPNGIRSLAFYHRPMKALSTMNGHAAIPMLLDRPPRERESTCIAYVPLDAVKADIANLLRPVESIVVLAPDGAWGRIKTGGGTPPVRIAEGWFSLYHAVDATERPDGTYEMIYRAGVVIHDLERPHLVRYRSPEPVLSPEGSDEKVGTVNDVVFPTGIDVLGERAFDVYYGAADAKIGRVRIDLPPVASAAGETAA